MEEINWEGSVEDGGILLPWQCKKQTMLSHEPRQSGSQCMQSLLHHCGQLSRAFHESTQACGSQWLLGSIVLLMKKSSPSAAYCSENISCNDRWREK